MIVACVERFGPDASCHLFLPDDQMERLIERMRQALREGRQGRATPRRHPAAQRPVLAVQTACHPDFHASIGSHVSGAEGEPPRWRAARGKGAAKTSPEATVSPEIRSARS